MRHLGFFAGLWPSSYTEKEHRIWYNGLTAPLVVRATSVGTFLSFHLRKGTDTAANIHVFCFEYIRVFRVQISVNLKYR